MTRDLSLPLSRRVVLRAGSAALAAAAVGCGTPHPAPGGAGRLRLIAEATLAHKLPFKDTTVGGLSGLDFDPASGLWAALSDDRSELQPARFYTLRLEAVAGRTLFIQLLDAVTLRQAAGTPYPPRRAGGEVVDPEALRLLPGARTLLWASEGDLRAHQGPSLHEARIDGTHARTFAMPPLLHASPRPGTGPRDNLGFEGLALTLDGRHAWAAMEGPLQQDGDAPTLRSADGCCRFTQFELASGRATRQVAYRPDPLPLAPSVPGGFADNGVSEILMLDDTRMLVLERAFAMGAGNSLRLYEIDTRAADDTLALDRLVPGQFRPVDKVFVANLAQAGLSRLDNTEGMAWGPRRPDGRRTLYVVSDDNFNPSQVTQFAAFEYLE
jgi:hypothetical protein